MNSIQWREQKETRYNDNEECAASDPIAAHEDDARLEKKKDISGDEVSLQFYNPNLGIISIQSRNYAKFYSEEDEKFVFN